MLEIFADACCPAWVAGGWGVDALVGRQTREHRYLDVAIDAGREEAALSALAAAGFVIETDWRPVRVELRAAQSRLVDVHPVTFLADGSGRQADVGGGFFDYPRSCFTTGVIAGVVVPCLGRDQQVAFHSGYAPRDIDLHDLAQLRALGA